MRYAIGILLALLPAAPAAGQPEETKRVEPVVVTATKIETPVAELGASVSVVNGDDFVHVGRLFGRTGKRRSGQDCLGVRLAGGQVMKMPALDRPGLLLHCVGGAAWRGSQHKGEATGAAEEK